MQQSVNTDLKKYLQLVVRRKELFVVVALLLTTAVFVTSYLLPKKYESTSTVFIEKNVISELVKGITVTPSMEDTINVLTYAITSRTLLTKVVDSLDMNLAKNDTEHEELIKTLQMNTKVKVKDKNLFTISFTDKNPRVARDFVNTLVRLYIEENMSSKRGESYDATKFLTEQIDTFNKKLEKAESEVNAYKREKGGVISIDEGKLFQEINTAQQKLYDLELRRRQLEGMRGATRRANDPLQVKLAQLQKHLEELRVSYTDSYPDVVNVKNDIETVKEQLKQRRGAEVQALDPQEVAKIESEIGAIKVTEEGLHRYIATNKKLLETIPTAKAGLEKLELEQKNQKNIYDQLFTRQSQSEVSKQMEVQDKSTTFRVVDPAVLPIKPASPNRLRLMALGIVGGLAGAFALLVLLDQADPSIKGVESAKGFGVPVLAVIPMLLDPKLVAIQQKRSRRIFAGAAVYFLLLLVFPALELLGLPYVDRMVESISPSAIVQDVKGHLHR
ncbi:XrtA system polysaccharide chain length determinant [Geomesophilobacter sediminis]|uniref:Chain-length determining protein n=1 Tax=Geomesophilobacter sediminis TaxID=2798584 RepID=A0A8J7JDI8_9BACT|nr:XrtA system polysaccharide chain length determinant [Geomesophilobacter sediminis]MBJ6723669.1 chain-length determining protein [Geomesophilobacter sediminis]